MITTCEAMTLAIGATTISMVIKSTKCDVCHVASETRGKCACIRKTEL